MYTLAPQWTKAEQALIDMMEISGAPVSFFTYYDHSCEVKVHLEGEEIRVTKDTPFEAIRVAFERWNRFKNAKN